MSKARKLRMNILVAGMAIVFFCGPTAPAQTGADDPNVQKAKGILLKGVASGNPDTRSLAVMSASLIGDRSEVLTKLYSMLETDKDVPTRITIISTLGSFSNPAVVPSLQKALKDPVPGRLGRSPGALWSQAGGWESLPPGRTEWKTEDHLQFHEQREEVAGSNDSYSDHNLSRNSRQPICVAGAGIRHGICRWALG